MALQTPEQPWNLLLTTEGGKIVQMHGVQDVSIDKDEAENDAEHDASMEKFRAAAGRSMMTQTVRFKLEPMDHETQLAIALAELESIVPQGWSYRVTTHHGRIEGEPSSFVHASIWNEYDSIVESGETIFDALSAAKRKLRIVLARIDKRLSAEG